MYPSLIQHSSLEAMADISVKALIRLIPEVLEAGFGSRKMLVFMSVANSMMLYAVPFGTKP